jgi:hypothetical protein
MDIKNPNIGSRFPSNLFQNLQNARPYGNHLGFLASPENSVEKIAKRTNLDESASTLCKHPENPPIICFIFLFSWAI